MRIGIVTYHRSHNYGAILQAIALRLYLQRAGHDVFYIDYWPEHHRLLYKLFPQMPKHFSEIIPFIVQVLKLITCFSKLNKRKRKFEETIKKHIIPYCVDVGQTFDTIIYGSDQIWKQQPIINDYDSFYFANHSVRANKYIAYSASMGLLPNKAEEKDKIFSYLLNFDSISVREDDLYHLLSECHKLNNIHKTIDPTLLLDKSHWDRLIKRNEGIKNKYILHYNLNNDFDEDMLSRYALEVGCQLITVTGFVKLFENKHTNSNIDPIEFISLIENAEFVFTSSYHGLVFSLIFNKEFYASFAKNSNRAVTLLSELNLTDRLLPSRIKKLPKLNRINYEIVQNKLKDLKNDSEVFLNNSL